MRDGNWRVVLWKWSRWGRDLRESLIYLAQVEDGLPLLDEWDRFTPADHREALSRILRHIVVMPGPYVPGQKVVPVPAWKE